jgi:hypothetical protein
MPVAAALGASRGPAPQLDIERDHEHDRARVGEPPFPAPALAQIARLSAPADRCSRRCSWLRPRHGRAAVRLCCQIARWAAKRRKAHRGWPRSGGASNVEGAKQSPSPIQRTGGFLFWLRRRPLPQRPARSSTKRPAPWPPRPPQTRPGLRSPLATSRCWFMSGANSPSERTGKTPATTPRPTSTPSSPPATTSA